MQPFLDSGCRIRSTGCQPVIAGGQLALRNCRHWLLLMSLLLTGCDPGAVGNEAPVETWRFAIEESDGSVQHAYAVRFKELIEERTGGEVEVIIYPIGTLGTSTHVTEQLKMGVVELAMASPGSLGKFIPEMQVFLLHFLLPEDPLETRDMLTDPELLAAFDELYEPKGWKLLSIYSEGQMVWTLQEEVRQPADFSGIKMRTMTTPLLLAAYNAYGASATPMPYGEVYSGLQLNQIQGQVNPVFAIERQKFHEVTSWLIFPRHASFITTCAANRPFYEALSEERREMVDQTIAELDEYIHDTQVDSQIERMKEIIADKQRQGKTLHVIGDLDWFLDSLTAEERKSLIEENEYLELHPQLTPEELERFRTASEQVQEVYLQIGGPSAEAMLRMLSGE